MKKAPIVVLSIVSIILLATTIVFGTLFLQKNSEVGKQKETIKNQEKQIKELNDSVANKDKEIAGLKGQIKGLNKVADDKAAQEKKPKEEAAKPTVRHEYQWFTMEENPEGGWKTIDNDVEVKVSGNTITATGEPLLLNKLDSGTDESAKDLERKTRSYTITPKTKYYSLHWSDATKISKKDAIDGIKNKGYQGFQVVSKGGVVQKIYMIAHGS